MEDQAKARLRSLTSGPASSALGEEGRVCLFPGRVAGGQVLQRGVGRHEGVQAGAAGDHRWIDEGLNQ